MSVDRTLQNLKVLSQVPQNGRIAISRGGIIYLEEETLYTCIKRFLFDDGRRQSVAEIQRNVQDATDKADDLLNSRYMQYDDGGHPQFPDDYQKRLDHLQLLCTELEAATAGMENLKCTYRDDATTIAALDLLITRVNFSLKKFKPHAFA